MAKLCKKCGIPIYGKSRKWCAKCKRDIHLTQMNDYYIAHTDRYQYGGLYWDQQSNRRCGTSGLGEHAINNFDIELKKIEKEMISLGLRDKKENWRYKNDK